MVDITPEVLNETVRETIILCCRDQNERMLSLSSDTDASEDVYYLKEAAIDNVINLKTSEEISQYILHNPPPRKMKEIFNRIEEMYPDFVFTSKAYKTAASRESAYRTIGYNQILNTFHVLHKVLLPFYREKSSGKSELDLFQELLATYNIDISPESTATLNLYEKQRQITIDGKKHTFSNHIKFNKDACRIHFKYLKDQDKIFIGHSGKHLDTAT